MQTTMRLLRAISPRPKLAPPNKGMHPTKPPFRFAGAACVNGTRVATGAPRRRASRVMPQPFGGQDVRNPDIAVLPSPQERLSVLFVDHYTVDRDHLLFDEILQVYATAAYHELVTGRAEDVLWLRDGGYRLELYDVDKFAECVRASTAPRQLRVRAAFCTLPSEPGVASTEGGHLVAGSLIMTAAVHVVGYAFESRREWLRKHFGAVLPGRWPVDMQFFRHLRNGCFHGNRCDIRPNRDGTSPIDASAPPQWESFAINARESFHGKAAIGEVLPYACVIPFLHDMGNRLREMGWGP